MLISLGESFFFEFIHRENGITAWPKAPALVLENGNRCLALARSKIGFSPGKLDSQEQYKKMQTMKSNIFHAIWIVSAAVLKSLALDVHEILL